MIKQVLLLFICLSLTHPLTAQDTLNTIHDTTYITGDSLLISSYDSTFVDTTKSLMGEDVAAQVDTLTPLYQQPFTVNSSFITRREFLKTDYKYTPNLFDLFSLSFLNDRGLAGHPDELFLYGVSNYGTSYFKDGIYDNDRLTGFLDLNSVQSENIDSIEIVPSPRAFLYGPYNSAAAVNFITKDEISIIPYSRVKYYEGAYGEAMIDGIYNSVIFKKFVLAVDITNRKKDRSYRNTDYGIWHVTAKLKYLLSNSVNLTGSYEHVNSDVGLNGGVNIDSILAFTSDLNTFLYNNSAPVNYLQRRYENEQHNFKLRLFGKLFNTSNSDINVYHKIYQNEIINPIVDYNLYRNEISGAAVRQKLLVSFAELSLNGNYEYSKLKYLKSDSLFFNEYDYKYNNYSASGIVSAYFADSLITPSFFYKISGEKELNSGLSASSHGSGLDVFFNLYDNFKLYFGYSIYETNRTSGNSASTEAGASLNFENLYLKLNLFSRKDFSVASRIPNQPNFNFGSINGAGLVLNYSFWNFNVQTQSSIYYNKENLYYLYPQFQFSGGLYYTDKLFNDNLDLKTGLTFYYYGKKDAYTLLNLAAVAPSNRIDFMLVGEIQQSATAYFTFENILNSEYYLIPYYPMLERSIRFGVAWEFLN